MAIEHVKGKNAGHVMLYALSTCIWCKKTKQLLEELGVAFDYEYIDLLKGADRSETLKKVHQHNHEGSFPTLLIDGNCIVGFQEPKIREALGQPRNQ